MDKSVLFVNACVRKESRTERLADKLLKRINRPFDEVCLRSITFPAVNEDYLNKRDRHIAARDFNSPLFDFARQFSKAEIIVIAAPYWDLSFPAALKQYFEQVQSNGTASQIVADFVNARSFFDDRLKLGERYVFGKRSGRILSYYDLQNVYQYIHKTNFVEDRRALRVNTNSNETVDICKMKLRGKSDDELMIVVMEMLKKNNRITVGYKK